MRKICKPDASIDVQIYAMNMCISKFEKKKKKKK